MITLFSTPKNFTGIFNDIQLNALRSWRSISNEIQIIILGDSNGSKEAALEINAEYIPIVKSTNSGIPYLSDLFKQAENRARYDVMTFINADIILPDNFLDFIPLLTKNFNKYLMIGHRWDMDVMNQIDFKNKKNINKFWNLAEDSSQMHACTGIDYFIFKKNQWGRIPDFAIGRPGYDNWLIWNARRHFIPVIDASNYLKVIHQNHNYNFHNLNADPKVILEEDGLNNKKIHGNKTLNLLDTNYQLEKGVIIKKTSKEYINRNLGKLPIIFPELAIPLSFYKRFIRRYFYKK